MWRRRTRREWDRLAHYFDHLTQAGLLPAWPPKEIIESVLAELKPNRILDCACGSGVLLTELKERGLDVFGADISPQMIDLAKKNAAARNIHIPYVTAEWQELPERIAERFDLVLCLGNALSHCESKRARQESIFSIAQMLNPGGVLLLDVRDWVKFRAERERYAVRGPRYIMGKRVIMVVVNTVPEEWERPVTTEYIVIEDGDEQLESELYTTTYFPYNVGDIVDAMQSVGLVNVNSVPFDSGAGFFLFGVKPGSDT
ncbi:MAG: class I SAM-dependent methyltransferase [Myxococcales bacterium]|nr:class I SAM-dependent methyltransferase [Myxococcales bacterium]